MTSPRDTMFGVIAAVAIATSCRAVASIEVVYGPISDSNLRAALKERRIGEHLRSHLIAFAPTADLRLVIADCGIANAFYRHGGLVHEIQVCAELLDQFVRQQRDTGAGARGAGGAALWVTGHELGHYLIQRHRVPLLGREEDAADQVGFAIIMRSRIPSEALIGTLRYFDRSPEHQDPGDVHSLDATRRVNMACWAYGTTRAKFSELAAIIPADRLPRCRGEAVGLWRAIQHLEKSARASGRRPNSRS